MQLTHQQRPAPALAQLRRSEVGLGEAARTLPEDRSLRFITDGNPAYQAGVHFLNAHRPTSQPPFTLRQVMGLETLDAVSTEFRPFKQLIERLNRTYKYHVRSACGFATQNGAFALTTLFVAHYNFLRPHGALSYQVPIPVPELSSVATLQGKWNKILELALAVGPITPALGSSRFRFIEASLCQRKGHAPVKGT